MSYTIGSYVHVTSKEKNEKNESTVVQGTIVNIKEDGTIVMDNGKSFDPEQYEVFVFNNVQSISQAEKLARAAAMRNHPAGKGRL